MPDQLNPSVGPSVQPAADLPMNADARSYSAGVGGVIEQHAEAMTRIHREEVAQANQTAVLDADNKSNAFLNRKLYDPKTGLLNQHLGKDAIGASDQTLADYDKHVGEVTATLTNPEQKAQYQRSAQAQRFGLERQLDAYAHGETSRYANEVDTASRELARTAAVQNANNPDEVMHQIAKIGAVTIDQGRRNGLSQEAIDAQLASETSATHLAVMTQMLNEGNDQAADAWYKDHKGELTASDAAQAAARVKVGSTVGEALRVGDSLVVPNAEGVMPNRLDLYAKIAGMGLSPQSRQMAEQRVDQLLGEHTKAIAEDQRQAFTAAAQIVQDPSNNLGVNDPRVQQARLSMSPEHWNNLEAMAHHSIPQTDPVVAYRLKVALADPATRATMANTDLTTIPGLDPRSPEFKELANEQAEAIKGLAPKQTGAFQVSERALGIILRGAGIKEKTPEADRLGMELERRGREWELANPGKQYPPEQAQKDADALMIDTVLVPGSVYGSNAKPIYQLTPDERARASLPASEFAKRDPYRAAQATANLKSRAVKLGLTPERVAQAGYNRALANTLIARDLENAGDHAGAAAALSAIDNDLRWHYAAPAQEKAGGAPLGLPDWVINGQADDDQ